MPSGYDWPCRIIHATGAHDERVATRPLSGFDGGAAKAPN
jgi:hypothetical protein